MTKQPTTQPPEDLVKTYLSRQNRPFGLTDLTVNLKSQIKKSQLVKALATLKENGEINEKVWGKTIIYSAIQECSEDVSELQQELAQLTAKVDDLNQKIKTKTRKLKAEKSLCQLQIELTQARELKSKLEIEAKELKQRNIPKETIKIDEKEYSFLLNEWKVKKRLFKNMWDTALEQYEGNIKELKEKLSIETDEDFQMNMKDY